MDLDTLQNTPPWEWQEEEARKTIHKILIDRRASDADRETAAELAGQLVVMNDALAEALLAIVGSSDEPEELRGRAAISLGPVLEQASNEEFEGFEDPEGVPVSLETYDEIKVSLHKLYTDETTPKDVRRRILEASVRAREDWNPGAIRVAYASGDRDWILTAVFSMQYIRGFDDQIMEALKSSDLDIHYHAIRAAGNWELDAAWPHIIKLLTDPATPKPLLLAAIEAAGCIRPQEAREILVDLTDSNDEEIADAAEEAMTMAEGRSAEAENEEDDQEEEDYEGREDSGEWIN
jgi:hypothetical protein